MVNVKGVPFAFVMAAILIVLAFTAEAETVAVTKKKVVELAAHLIDRPVTECADAPKPVVIVPPTCTAVAKLLVVAVQSFKLVRSVAA